MSGSCLISPWSVHLTLEETLQRLEANDRVRSVGFLGSTGTDEWTEASDFDLCILLRDYPVGCGVEVTLVDGRVTDVVIIDADQAVAWGSHAADHASAVATGAVSEAEWPFVCWLAQARPVHDPDGLAGRVRDQAKRLTSSRPPMDPAWQQTTRSFLSHDVKVNAALLSRVDDPVLRVALGMRQLHTFVAAVQAWFSAQGIHNAGWKKDMAKLAEADPAFFEVIQRWLATSDVTARHDLFCEVVHQSAGPDRRSTARGQTSTAGRRCLAVAGDGPR